MTNGYLVSTTTLILLISLYASVSEGADSIADYFRVKIRPAEIAAQVRIYNGACNYGSPPSVEFKNFETIDNLSGEYRINKLLAEDHCLQVVKHNGQFEVFTVSANVLKRNQWFLIDFTNKNNRRGIQWEVPKGEEAKFGINTEAERKRKEQVEEEARKKTELTTFTNEIAQNFSSQMETMLAKFSKELMAAVDSKFTAHSKAMNAKLEESKKEIATSNLSILQNAKITIGGKEMAFPHIFDVLAKQIGQQHGDMERQALAISELHKTIGEKGSGLVAPLTNAVTKDMAKEMVEVKKEINSVISGLLMPLKTTMDINHTNLKERFEFLMTLGKNSSLLVEEVNKKIGPIEVELKKMLTEQQSKDIEASVVKNSVETIRGNVHKFFTYFCNIFKCDHLKMSPSTIAPDVHSAPKSPAPNGNSAPNVPNTNSKPNANSTPIVN